MSQSMRKLVGSIAILLLVIVYALVATAIAAAKLADAPWWGHLAYFLFSGLLWVLPAMLIISWMLKPRGK